MFSRQKSGDNFFLQKYTNNQEQNNALQQGQNKYQSGQSEIQQGSIIGLQSNSGMNKYNQDYTSRKSSQLSNLQGVEITPQTSQNSCSSKLIIPKSQNEFIGQDGDQNELPCQTAPSLIDINMINKNFADESKTRSGNQLGTTREISSFQQEFGISNNTNSQVPSNQGSKTRISQNLSKPKNNYYVKSSDQHSYSFQTQLQNGQYQTPSNSNQYSTQSNGYSSALMNMQKDIVKGNKINSSNNAIGYGSKSSVNNTPQNSSNGNFKGEKDKSTFGSYHNTINSNFKNQKQDITPTKQVLQIQSHQFGDETLKYPSNNLLQGPYSNIQSPNYNTSQKFMYSKQNSLGESNNKFSSQISGGQTSSFNIAGQYSNSQNNNLNNEIKQQFSTNTNQPSQGQLSTSCSSLSKQNNKASSQYDQYLVKQNDQKQVNKNTIESISGLQNHSPTKNKSIGLQGKRINPSFNINGNSTSQDFNNVQQLYFQEKTSSTQFNNILNHQNSKSSSHHRRQNSYSHKSNNACIDNEEQLDDMSLTSQQVLNMSVGIRNDGRICSSSNTSAQMIQLPEHLNQQNYKQNNLLNSQSIINSNNQYVDSLQRKISPSKMTFLRESNKGDYDKNSQHNINQSQGVQKNTINSNQISNKNTLFPTHSRKNSNNTISIQQIHNDDEQKLYMQTQNQQNNTNQILAQNIYNVTQNIGRYQDVMSEKNKRNSNTMNKKIEINGQNEQIMNQNIYSQLNQQDSLNENSDSKLNQNYLLDSQNVYDLYMINKNQILNDSSNSNNVMPDKHCLKTNYPSYTQKNQVLSYTQQQQIGGQQDLSNLKNSQSAASSPQTYNIVQGIQKNVFFTKQNSLNTNDDSSLSENEFKNTTNTISQQSYTIEKPSQFKEYYSNNKKEDNISQSPSNFQNKPIQQILSYECQQISENLYQTPLSSDLIQIGSNQKIEISQKGQTTQKSPINLNIYNSFDQQQIQPFSLQHQINLNQTQQQNSNQLQQIGQIQSYKQVDPAIQYQQIKFDQLSFQQNQDISQSQQLESNKTQQIYLTKSSSQANLNTGNEGDKYQQIRNFSNLPSPSIYADQNPQDIQKISLDQSNNPFQITSKNIEQNINIKQDNIYLMQPNKQITPDKHISSEKHQSSKQVSNNYEQFQVSNNSNKQGIVKNQQKKSPMVNNKVLTLSEDHLDQSQSSQLNSSKQKNSQTFKVSLNNGMDYKDEENVQSSIHSIAELFKTRNKIHEKAINRVNITLKQNKKRNKSNSKHKDREEASQDDSGSDSSFNELNSQKSSGRIPIGQITVSTPITPSNGRQQAKQSSMENMDQMMPNSGAGFISQHGNNYNQIFSQSTKLVEEDDRLDQTKRSGLNDSSSRISHNKTMSDSSPLLNQQFLDDSLRRKSPLKGVTSPNKGISKNQYLLNQNITSQAKKIDRNTSLNGSKIISNAGLQPPSNEDSKYNLTTPLSQQEVQKHPSYSSTSQNHMKNLIQVTQDKHIDIEDPMVQKEFSQIVRNLLKLKNDTSKFSSILTKNEVKSMNSSLNSNAAIQKNNRNSTNAVPNSQSNNQQKHDQLFEKLYQEIVNKFDSKTTSVNNNTSQPSFNQTNLQSSGLQFQNSQAGQNNNGQNNKIA